MAVNLDIDSSAWLNAEITPQEMQDVLAQAKRYRTQDNEDSDADCELNHADVTVENPVITAGIRLRGNIIGERAAVRIIKLMKPAKKLRSKPKRKSTTELAGPSNGAVRKYAKEMRNRDIIAKKSKAMRLMAKKTASSYDDKFAQAAASPTSKFDKIIYGSATAGDAADKLDALFDSVTSSVKEYE